MVYKMMIKVVSIEKVEGIGFKLMKNIHSNDIAEIQK